MDSYEATRIVFSQIQSLDPENASKIMGYILIQDHGDKEMIRLALGPESLLHQLIAEAKTQLGLLSSRPNPLSIPSSASRLAAGNGGSSPASSSSSPWSVSGSLSYANVVNGTGNGGSVSGSGSSLSSSAFSYYAAGAGGNNSGELVDEYQLQDRLSFLNDQKGDDLLDYGETHLQNQHRRSYSVPGVFFGSPEDPNSGFGWKPCLYFARGFCKNGSTCRFLHGGESVPDGTAGSPEQLLRSKTLAGVGTASFPYSKCVNFLLQQENENQRSAALMIGDELLNFGRCRPERNAFPVMGLGGALNSPSSRQIYLTFPADSTFREEDVSNYFSIYGPVHDVRIPYQQKRMFGFVTFVYPETVKLILAKGNPHFVCDSRVLVKPYKEKGKIPDKKLQHMDRGDFDSGEPYGLNFGPRMFYNAQEMLLKRKLEEQADLQQAIELHERRLMSLQLLDLKNHRHHHQFHQGLSPIGSPVPAKNQTRVPSPNDGTNQEALEGSSLIATADQKMSGDCNHENDDCDPNDECDLHESLEHILPDNLFASPKKSAGDNLTVFSPDDHVSTSSTTNSQLPATSALNMASIKSCFLQIPRFSSAHGTIGL